MSGFTMGPSLLFCPADRPERYRKAAERADAVILDLEDAVAPENKEAAREALIDSALDPERTIVRINPVPTGDFLRDCAALRRTSYRTVMLAKAGSGGDLRDVGLHLPSYDVIALCETAAGVLKAPHIAIQPNVTALMWGAEDLVASLGGTSSRGKDGAYRGVAAHARSQVLLAAGAAGIPAIDSVYLNIPDLDGLAAEAEDAAASGFFAKACIHPSQAGPVRRAYVPSDEEVEQARDLLREAAGRGGVFQYQGRMIDGPILRHAEQVLSRVRD